MPEQAPSIGRIVHYVSYGTPRGEYPKTCRAAIIAAVRDGEPVPEHGVPYVDLVVLNPTGLFFNQECKYDEGGETPGSGDCAMPESHGNPFRYCSCGWIEASHRGGTWHWPERV
jgi:hypothetical protein